MTTTQPKYLLLPLALAIVNTTACGDDAVCGPEASAIMTIDSTLGTDNLVWERWRSSPNNDCGEPGGPTSLTLDAFQVGTGRSLTFCLPRPDKLSGTIPITESTQIQVIDVFAEVTRGAEQCLVSLDRTMMPTGEVTFEGVCDKGTHPDGYSVAMDIALPVSVMCGADMSSEMMTFAGAAIVTARTQ